MWLSGFLGPVACTELGDEDPFPRERGTLAVHSTFPAQGQIDVDPWTGVEVCYRQTLDPLSASDFAASLGSGIGFIDSNVDIQLVPWRNKGSRSQLLGENDCPGSILSVRPRTYLIPGALYRLRVTPYLRGWEGERMDADDPFLSIDPDGDPIVTFEFTIREPNTDPPRSRPPVMLEDLFEPGAPFDPQDGACSCHGIDGEDAVDHLDLRGVERARESLADPRLHATQAPLVSPGRPAESYLLRKMVRVGDSETLEGVLGQPMPPAPLPYDEQAVSLISAWIFDGAQSKATATSHGTDEETR